MKKKQTLAMLLAVAMVLSMPVGAYAEELDGVENSAGLVEPYIADKEAPVLHDIQIDKTSVNAGENITITIDATDDLSNTTLKFLICQISKILVLFFIIKKIEKNIDGVLVKKIHFL